MLVGVMVVQLVVWMAERKVETLVAKMENKWAGLMVEMLAH